MNRISINGRKKKGDKMYGFKCKCGECFFPSYDDLGWLTSGCFDNEELLYPRSKGLLGGKMLILKLFEDIKKKGYDIETSFLIKTKNTLDDYFR